MAWIAEPRVLQTTATSQAESRILSDAGPGPGRISRARLRTAFGAGLIWLGLAWAQAAQPLAKPAPSPLSPSVEGGSHDISFTGWDTLFITAASGEPRLKAARDSCEKILVARDSATLNYLLTSRLKDQTPRQRHYVERLFGMLSDSGRKALPGRLLRIAVDTASDSLKAQLLYVASTLGDTSLRSLGKAYIGHAQSEVRRMAARILGIYPRAEHAALLLQGLEGAIEVERHQRMWALAAVAPYPGCDRLEAWLDDASLAVRQMAVKALGRCADGTFEALHLTLPENRSDSARPTLRQVPSAALPRSLALMETALAIRTPAALAYARRLSLALPMSSRRYYEAALADVYNKPDTGKPAR